MNPIIKSAPAGNMLSTANGSLTAAVVADVEMVSVVLCAVVPEMATLDEGLKEQDASAGRLPQVKVTVPEKLFCGVRLSVSVPLFPEATATVELPLALKR